MVIQELWKKGVTWDEILETSLQKQLGLWWGEATQLGELHFPRWIEFTGEPIVVHLFTDASEKAYGNAIYAMVGLKSFHFLLRQRSRRSSRSRWLDSNFKQHL